MKFEGRIYRVFPVQSGTSSRGEWKRQDFLFEYFENPNDRWSDKVLLSVMNDRIAEYNIQEGDKVIIGFGHNVNEYNGRYYNELKMYHFERAAQPTENGQSRGYVGQAIGQKVTDTYQQPQQATLFPGQTSPNPSLEAGNSVGQTSPNQSLEDGNSMGPTDDELPF